MSSLLAVSPQVLLQHNNSHYLYQGSGREKDENRGKFISSNLVIYCYNEFEKFALCKSVSQSETTFIVEHLSLSQSKVVMQKLIFHNSNTSKM